MEAATATLERTCARLIVGLGCVMVVALALVTCGDRRPTVPAVRRWTGPTFAELPLPELTFQSEGPSPDAPRRIVSLIPSVTEIVFTLGLGDRLVGRSTWCDWPRAVAALPDLGDLRTRSPERIADLRPDVVFLFRSDVELTKALRADFGLHVVTPSTEEQEAFRRGILEVASALSVEGRGQELVAWIEKEFEAVRARWATREPPRVLVVLDRSSWWVPGHGSFIDRLLILANASSVSGQLAGSWPSVSYENVLEWAPELVLDLSVGTDSDAWYEQANEFWGAQRSIPAARNGRVILLQAGVLARPGPRAPAVAELLARILHEGQ